MNLGKDIEHGGYPTSDTRTISQMRRDADAYAGIGRRARFKAGTTYPAANRIVQEKSVDAVDAIVVRSRQSHNAATETKPSGATMTLTLKGLSKNGKNAYYTGAANILRFPLAAFINKTAPQIIEIEGDFAGPKTPAVKLTPEERKALRAARPKPTLAELAARAQKRADALAAKVAAAQAGDAPQL